ncbi:MAG TPA: tRNA lysidine(34) synthetase TilS [Acidimicrobiia bacterium]|nr:tRNA lysidine(34) synthetase TilS [Acidimicrobiia bacterium]
MSLRACAPWLDRLVGLEDLSDGARVVVGCSGGADSVALLAMSCALGFDTVAVYVDHGLRAGTAHEAAAVARIARCLGATSRVEVVDVAAGPNLEARAREARYVALERARADTGARVIFVGHTRDDQAETVLMHVLRGSGTAGLAGIPRRRGHLRRPLLSLRRADTNEVCARLGYTPVHDPMNGELHHRRVWMRREIIPQLERGADRDLVEVLARQADLLRDDDTLLDTLAAERGTDDAKAIAAMPVALARRMLRQRFGPPPPSAATIERVLAVARGDRVATELPGGAEVRRVGGRLVRIDPGRVSAPRDTSLSLPGRARFGDLVLEAWIERGPPTAWPDGRWLAVCDADLIAGAAVIRACGRTPVVECGGPVWSVGYGVDRRVRVTTSTRRFLWLSAEPANP